MHNLAHPWLLFSLQKACSCSQLSFHPFPTVPPSQGLHFPQTQPLRQTFLKGFHFGLFKPEQRETEDLTVTKYPCVGLIFYLFLNSFNADNGGKRE